MRRPNFDSGGRQAPIEPDHPSLGRWVVGHTSWMDAAEQLESEATQILSQDIAKARALLDRAQKIRDQEDGPSSNLALELSLFRATVHQMAGATKHAEAALLRFEKQPRSLLKARALTSLALLQHDLGAPNQAQKFLALALEAVGDDHPEMKIRLVVLRGELLLGLADLEGAASCFEEALLMSPPEAPELFALALRGKGHLELSNNAPRKAQRLFERALEHLEAQAPDSPMIARTMADLGYLFASTGQHEDSLQSYEAALDQMVLGGEPSSIEAGQLAERCAALLLYQLKTDFDKAEALLLQALGIFEMRAGPEHPLVAEVLIQLAHLDLLRGAPKRAQVMLKRALHLLELHEVPTFAARWSFAISTLASGEIPDVVVSSVQRAASEDRSPLDRLILSLSQLPQTEEREVLLKRLQAVASLEASEPGTAFEGS